MKNKALILTIIAIAAIAFVVWYFFIRQSPSYLYKRYASLYRQPRAFSYPCNGGTVYYTASDVVDPSNQTQGTFDVNKLCANKLSARR